MKPVDVTTEINIFCPVTEVAEYIFNPDNAPLWYVNIKSVEWKSPKPLQLNSQIAFKAKFLGKELVYIYNIVEWVHHKKLVMRTVNGPFPMETTYVCTALPKNQTKVMLRNRGLPSGFSTLLRPIISIAIKRANKKDLGLLKYNLELKNQHAN